MFEEEYFLEPRHNCVLHVNYKSNLLKPYGTLGFLVSTKIQSRFLAPTEPTATAARTKREVVFFALLVHYVTVSLSIEAD